VKDITRSCRIEIASSVTLRTEDRNSRIDLVRAAGQLDRIGGNPELQPGKETAGIPATLPLTADPNGLSASCSCQ
jgi:hypothetical protein